MFHELPAARSNGALATLSPFFDGKGVFRGGRLSELMPVISSLYDDKQVRIQEPLLQRIDASMMQAQLDDLRAQGLPPLTGIKTLLYPYQQDGVAFALYKSGALIGDEMGLGKTLQAIALGILKRDVFDFTKILVITLSSLKEQWRREIERFTDEKATIVAGSQEQRRQIYFNDQSLFKITNYEAVLRDVLILSRYKPDLIILDEAQRIKNFSTKTADAVKQIPRKHAVVLTGTPLENKLEDIYSIIQFLSPGMLSPLWHFAAEHYMLSRKKKGKILGYTNLDKLHERLSAIVIRRRKEQVLTELPDEIVNNYYLELTDPQKKIHGGYIASLLPLLNKKYITPVDLRRIMELLLKARMVCNSTYLIDRKSHISPKLQELEGILEELVVSNGRKVVIFSEWTTMTFLIGRHLSEAGIQFVELSGKVPVHKRQALIDEFTCNPECQVFLSTDAGGTGLNLQAADCVINFELPWSPARLNQRIGRVNRIGQTSKCINVINLITKDSIEEKILAGIQLKTDLFKGVFDGGIDTVEFSREKRSEMLNRLREMMGEEPAPINREAAPTEEIPADAPGFLNPKVLGEAETEAAREETSVDVTGEEPAPADMAAGITESQTGQPADSSRIGRQSPEKMEAVLNSGMAFLGGLMEMATGQKLTATGQDGRMVQIDRQTGEVTLKFKLPGF
ncbi:MAG: DEAD/DEAH box helicase [Desulfobacterales bacterium]|nr:DEAD/DEAH box helicase [Desulfobacterales bacterium]